MREKMKNGPVVAGMRHGVFGDLRRRIVTAGLVLSFVAAVSQCRGESSVGSSGAMESAAGRMRVVTTHDLKAGQCLDTGFFMGVSCSAGAKVDELVGYGRDDPWRALCVSSLQGGRARLKSAYAVDVCGAKGPKIVEAESDGFIAFSLKGGESVLVVTKLTPVQISPRMDRSKFLIGAYSGVSEGCPSSLTERHVRLLAEADFDFIGSRVMSHQRDFLDVVLKYGMGAFVRDDDTYTGGGWSDENLRKKLPMATFDSKIAALKTTLRHPAIWGLDIFDEPSVTCFPYIGELVGAVTRGNPECPAHVNLYPNYASVSENSQDQAKSQLGTRTYCEYIDAYCRQVPLDYISYDHYPYFDSKEQTISVRMPMWYRNLTVAADACRRTGRSLWVIPQLVTHPTCTNRLSANKFRFQVYSAMAFGAEVVNWACWAPCWWHDTAIEADGTISDHFGKFRTVNREVHWLGRDYMRFRNVSTRFVGFSGEESERFEKVGIAVKSELSAGGIRRLKASDGSPLVVGGMIARAKGDVGRAVYVFTAGDMMDERRSDHVIEFEAHVPVVVKGCDGNIRIQRNDAGQCSFVLQDNRPALIVIEGGER